MSWMAGQAGIFLSLGMIVLSLVVVGVTAISMSAIATNGEIRNGGLYYLVGYRGRGDVFGCLDFSIARTGVWRIYWVCAVVGEYD
jgi:hypothetical protein